MTTSNIPPVRIPDDAGTSTSKRDIAGGDARQAPAPPETSGRSPEEDTGNAMANRDREGPRQAGATPRPSDKPIIGGGKGRLTASSSAARRNRARITKGTLIACLVFPEFSQVYNRKL